MCAWAFKSVARLRVKPHPHITLYMKFNWRRDWLGGGNYRFDIIKKVAKICKKNWMRMLRWILYTIHMIKFTNLIWFFFQRGFFFLSIIVYIEIKIVRFFSTNRQTNCQVLVQTDKQKGLENHQEGFQSCPLCINGITVDKKAASHNYNSNIFTRFFFHWLSFGRLKLISRVVFFYG